MSGQGFFLFVALLTIKSFLDFIYIQILIKPQYFTFKNLNRFIKAYVWLNVIP